MRWGEARHFRRQTVSGILKSVNKPLMTQAEYAAYRGVKPSAVSNWKKAGHVLFAEGEDSKLYVDVARTDARLAAKLDPTRGRPTTTQAVQASTTLFQAARPDAEAGGGVTDARSELMREQTIGHRLKNAKEAKELLPVVEYERRAAELGRLARERMHSIVRTLSERLAAERDPRQVTALLASEVDRAVNELADQVEAGALDAASDEPLAQAGLDDEAE